MGCGDKRDDAAKCSEPGQRSSCSAVYSE